MASVNFDTYIHQMAMDVAETQDEFIFQTIGPFVNDVAGFSISKQELVEAIQFIRLRKECTEKYGVYVGADWITATWQSNELSKAYDRGFAAGIKKERHRIRDLVREEMELK